MSRSIKLALAALLALVATVFILDVAGVIDLSSSDEEETSSPRSVDVSSNDLAEGPDELLVLAGGQLQVKRIEAQEEVDLGASPSSLPVPSLASEWLAFVEPGDTASERPPALTIFRPDEKPKEVGDGFSPSWDPTGQTLAFLRPTDESSCGEMTCSGPVEVATYSIGSDSQEVIQEASQWQLLGWFGGSILLADQELSTFMLDPQDGSLLEIEVKPQRLRSASPDGQHLLVESKKGTKVLQLNEEGEVVKQTILDLSDQAFLGGAWSHDGKSLAVVAELVPEEKNRKKATRSQVLLFTPGKSEGRHLDQSFSATSPVLWAADDEALVFPRVIDRRSGLHQVFYCPLRSESGCRVVTSFTNPLGLLRMQ